MEKPVLVIMAAGMGSRYGGLKQIDPIDEEGHIIMDFSIYDAKKAGFEKVIFIIRRENEADFREQIGSRVEPHMETVYVFQELENVPEGVSYPEDRIKPWGTGHAILSCRDVTDGPFVVINADDYYGPQAFAKIYDFLVSHTDDEKYRYAMVGYMLENTLTENGHVARGVCETDEKGYLTGITERTRIERRAGGAAYTEDEGKTWHKIPGGTTVSMNMWGFGKSFLAELEDAFAAFLKTELRENPYKCEFYIPSVVAGLLAADKATVTVLQSEDKWYGVTYKEDKPMVMAALQKLKDQRLYPQRLWD